jgi:hypothetical protein
VQINSKLRLEAFSLFVILLKKIRKIIPPRQFGLKRTVQRELTWVKVVSKDSLQFPIVPQDVFLTFKVKTS